MFNPNPYAHGAWPNGGNSNLVAPRGTLHQPSLFGALPYPTQKRQSPSTSWMRFHFNGFNPTILNCAVTGPQARTYFTIRTDSPTPGFTVITNARNEPVVVIDWTRHPMIEVRDTVSKRHTGQWLTLAEGKRYRTMPVRNRNFIWAPDDDDITLYSVGLGSPQVYARIYRDDDDVILQMTMEAVQIGLLEACVVAAVLLQCGRKID